MKTGRVLDTATTTQRKRARDGRMLARNKDDLQLQVRHWSQQLSRASKKTCLRSQLLVVIRAGRQLNQQKGAM